MFVSLTRSIRRLARTGLVCLIGSPIAAQRRCPRRTKTEKRVRAGGGRPAVRRAQYTVRRDANRRRIRLLPMQPSFNPAVLIDGKGPGRWPDCLGRETSAAVTTSWSTPGDGAPADHYALPGRPSVTMNDESIILTGIARATPSLHAGGSQKGCQQDGVVSLLQLPGARSKQVMLQVRSPRSTAPPGLTSTSL